MYKPLSIREKPTNTRRVSVTSSGKYMIPSKYGIGGWIGKAAGAVGGSFIGQPALGASIGGAIGSQFDGKGGSPEQQIEQHIMAAGTLGKFGNGGKYKALGGKAAKASGARHEQGGIQLTEGVEIEGGETIDQVQGEGYVFSDRLKVPNSKETFAERHEKLMSKGASASAVASLAKTQERVSGRSSRNLGNAGGKGTEELALGGTTDVTKRYYNPRTGGYNRGLQSTFSNYTYKPLTTTGKVPPKTPPKVTNTAGKGAAKTGARWLGKTLGPIGAGIEFLANPETIGDSSLSGQGKGIDYSQFIGKDDRHYKPAYDVMGNPVNRDTYGNEPRENTGKFPIPYRIGDPTDSNPDYPSPRGSSQSNPQNSPKSNTKVDNSNIEDANIIEETVEKPSLSNRRSETTERGDKKGTSRRKTENVSPKSAIAEAQAFGDGLNYRNTKSQANMPVYRFKYGGKYRKYNAGGAYTGMVDLDRRGTFNRTFDNVESPNKSLPSSGLSKSNSLEGLGEVGLQIAPDLINAGFGMFGKDKTPEPTKVASSRINNAPVNYNINPALESNASAYRGILSSPTASSNERLGAIAMKNRADFQAYATKANQETQIREQRNARQASLDANRNAQQASMDEQRTQDKMMSEANLGVTGNFARQSISNVAQKLMLMKRDKNLTAEDQRMIEMLEKYFGSDKALNLG